MKTLIALQTLAAFALAVAACAPAVNSQATQAAMESMHAEETQTAMEAMDTMHAEETKTAMEAMDTMHAEETKTAMEAMDLMHAEETKTALEAMGTMMTMSTGTFVALQHQGGGTAAIVGSEADGYHLELKGFSVDDGPDLHVVLTSQAPVDKMATALPEAVDLGVLTATEGDLTFEIPAGTDLGRVAAVVIWCEDFSVPFTFAALQTP